METILQILSAIGEGTGIEPSAFSSSTITELPCITYTAYRQQDNAVTEGWRLTIRVTAESYEEALTIETQVAELLCTLGDEERYDALKIEVSGGGAMEDETTGLPQLITYYDLTTRS